MFFLRCINASCSMLRAVLQLFRRIVRLDGLGLDDDGGVTALVVLRLVRNRTSDVATRHQYPGENDCHDE